MKSLIINSKESYEMHDDILYYTSGAATNILMKDLDDLIGLDLEKDPYNAYSELVKDITHYYEAIPLYCNNLKWSAQKLYDKIQLVHFHHYQAKKVVEQYYEHQFDLESLHNKLIQIFGNIKDAFEWFEKYDKARAI